MAPAQYLTAVFELRPTRRKAAALERVRASAEAVFWNILAEQRQRADAVAAIRAALEAEHGALIRWRVVRLTRGREVVPDAGNTGVSPVPGTTSPAAIALPAVATATGAVSAFPVPDG